MAFSKIMSQDYPKRCVLAVDDGAHTFLHELTDIAEDLPKEFSGVCLDHPPAQGVDGGVLSYLKLVGSPDSLESYSIGVVIEQTGPKALEARLETVHDGDFNPLSDGLLPLLTPVSYTHLTLPTIYSV